MINRFIDKLGFPTSNLKFEKTSIDGYAFYGWARANIERNTRDIELKIENFVYGLNDVHSIRGISVPFDDPYVYSCFPAFGFYKSIGREDKMDDIIRTLDDIGRYDNGMMRYCKTEIDYLCPNVTPLAALMYKVVERDSDAEELINALRDNQCEDGNWLYISPSDGVSYGKEDSMHLCMMIYALRETGSHDVADKAMEDVLRRNAINIQGGTIGWGFPWLALITVGVEDYKKLHSDAREKTIDMLRSKTTNFRTKAMSIWALSEIERRERIGKNNTL